MLSFTVTNNISAVQKALANYPTASQAAFAKAEQRAATTMKQELAKGRPGYPSTAVGKPPLRRPTGTLGRGWLGADIQLGVSANRTTLTGINPVNYAQWVMGPEQRPYHAAHGWPTVGAVQKRMQQAIRGYMLDAMREIAQSMHW